jgi:hypothetical protein
MPNREKLEPGWVRGRFCILAPEINGPPGPLETMPKRELRTCLVSLDLKRPTDVTAAMKDMNNRARSVAAGVVSGAGWCQPVLETPHFDESAPSRTRRSLDPIVFGVKRRGLGVPSARQLKGRVRATGGAGRKTHTRKG